MSSSTHQISFGGDASHLSVGPIGFGLMGLTWKDSSTFQDDETMFTVMKSAVDNGATFWNTGSFYCPQDKPYANLLLIRRFFEKHPEYMSKITISVKSGIDMDAYIEKGMAGMSPDASVENLTKDLKGIRKALNSDNGGHDVDLYEIARVDMKKQPKEWMANLMQVKKQGLFKHISLSEVGASTIRKAAAEGPIAAVEVEYSPSELSIETNGVLEACKELKIPIVAYSPIARGILSGGVSDASNLPKGDPRAHQEQFQADNLKHNAGLGDLLKVMAGKKGCTGAQLVLAWVAHQWPGRIIPIPGSTNATRAGENSRALSVVTLTDSHEKEIRDAVTKHGRKGGRYAEMARAHGNLFAEQ
jgi:pyridoxine 4-dehydrogenase